MRRATSERGAAFISRRGVGVQGELGLSAGSVCCASSARPTQATRTQP